MIFDHLSNKEIYSNISSKVTRGLTYLKETNLSKLELGKYFIEGTDIYVLVQEYETKPKDEMKWESHKKYIDIQHVVSGCEVIGYTNIKNLQLSEKYSLDKDIMFYTGEGDYLTLTKGCFVILFPEDGHKPGICLDKSNLVRKVVVKIPV